MRKFTKTILMGSLLASVAISATAFAGANNASAHKKHLHKKKPVAMKMAAKAADTDHSGHMDHSQHSKHSGDMKVAKAMTSGGHDHSKLTEIGGALYVPTVNLNVTKDRKSGWNIEIQTTGFQFAPMAASTPHFEGQGHAHLYVNGKKISRVYGNWLHIAKLPAGKSEISVSLNANDHSALAVNGVALKSTAIVENKLNDS